jgi:hypothetical protein
MVFDAVALAASLVGLAVFLVLRRRNVPAKVATTTTNDNNTTNTYNTETEANVGQWYGPLTLRVGLLNSRHKEKRPTTTTTTTTTPAIPVPPSANEHIDINNNNDNNNVSREEKMYVRSCSPRARGFTSKSKAVSN